MLGIEITDPWALIIVILSTSVCVSLLIYGVVPWVVRKKYPINDWVSLISSMVRRTETILNIVSKNDVNGRYTERLQLYNNIVSITKDAVYAAEQLYKTKKLDAKDRKNYAIEYTKKALQAGGVIISHDIEDLIKDSIESSVMAVNVLTNSSKSSITQNTSEKK